MESPLEVQAPPAVGGRRAEAQAATVAAGAQAEAQAPVSLGPRQAPAPFQVDVPAFRVVFQETAAPGAAERERRVSSVRLVARKAARAGKVSAAPVAVVQVLSAAGPDAAARGPPVSAVPVAAQVLVAPVAARGAALAWPSPAGPVWLAAVVASAQPFRAVPLPVGAARASVVRARERRGETRASPALRAGRVPRFLPRETAPRSWETAVSSVAAVRVVLPREEIPAGPRLPVGCRLRAALPLHPAPASF